MNSKPLYLLKKWSGTFFQFWLPPFKSLRIHASLKAFIMHSKTIAVVLIKTSSFYFVFLFFHKYSNSFLLIVGITSFGAMRCKQIEISLKIW